MRRPFCLIKSDTILLFWSFINLGVRLEIRAGPQDQLFLDFKRPLTVGSGDFPVDNQSDTTENTSQRQTKFVGIVTAEFAADNHRDGRSQAESQEYHAPRQTQLARQLDFVLLRIDPTLDQLHILCVFFGHTEINNQHDHSERGYRDRNCNAFRSHLYLL